VSFKEPVRQELAAESAIVNLSARVVNNNYSQQLSDDNGVLVECACSALATITLDSTIERSKRSRKHGGGFGHRPHLGDLALEQRDVRGAACAATINPAGSSS
jgi:hypothetical protein